MGTPDPDPVCGVQPDQDCPPGLSDGVGPGLVIDANLFMGNAAESGSGGGLRLQGANGTEVIAFPGNPENWYRVRITNNIIANNVAGWDGGGVSLHDALKVDFINNTVISNDSTASSGVLFDTLGAPLASAPGNNCHNTAGTSSCPQVAGLVSTQNSPPLAGGMATLTITCPVGYFTGTTATNGTCTKISYPNLANNVIWQNRSFFVGVGTLSSQYQQHIVTLFNASGTAAASQMATGACVAGSSYWDIGVRGDTGPANHASGFTLNPLYSFLTSTTGYSSTNNANNPMPVSQYCNGSRVPPEFAAGGYNVPPGISDAIVPNPVFTLTPAATVDEGNNWLNMTWGPLSLTNPSVSAGTPASYGGGPSLGNYTPTASSPTIDFVSTANAGAYPVADFFGNVRPDPTSPGAIDAGAVEFLGSRTAANASVTGGPLAFGNVPVGTTSAGQTLTLSNTGNANLTGIVLTFSSPRYSRPAGAAGGTCTTTLAPGSCTITVVFSPNAAGSASATLTITASVPVTGSPVALSGTGVAAAQGTLTFTSATNGTLTTVSGTRTLTFTIPNPRAQVTSVVTVTNAGTAPLTIGAESLLPVNTTFFTVTGNTCANTTVAISGSCTVSVRYNTPTTSSGVHSGSLNFANNGSGTTNGSTPLGLSGN